jgi:hypothetical protein
VLSASEIQRLEAPLPLPQLLTLEYPNTAVLWDTSPCSLVEIYGSGRACWLHISDTSLYTIYMVLGINIGLYGRIVRPNHLVFVVETRCVIFAVIPTVTITISLPSSRMCTVCFGK